MDRWLIGDSLKHDLDLEHVAGIMRISRPNE
jgi:hypothetical protein